MEKPQIHGGIASTRLPGLPPSPTGAPTLGGRLMPVRLANGKDFDLFWKDRADGKPSFRWQTEQNRLLILAKPDEKNVKALFDCAQEAGIGMPKIQITGTPEFQRIAAVEAARRGLPIDTKNMDATAAEIYRQTFSEQHGEAANSITAAAYESQHTEEQRRSRIAEAAAAKAKAGNDQGDGDDGDRRPAGPRN